MRHLLSDWILQKVHSARNEQGCLLTVAASSHNIASRGVTKVKWVLDLIPTTDNRRIIRAHK